MSEKEKIKQYLEYKGISKNKFHIETGLSVGFLNSGDSLGVDKLKIIMKTYPDISLKWLVLDEGDMIEHSSIKEDAVSDVNWMKDVIQNQAAALSRMTSKLESMEKEKGNQSLPVKKDASSVFATSQKNL